MKRASTPWMILSLALLILVGCGDGDSAPVKKKKTVIKVALYHGGDVVVGGMDSSIADLDARVATLSPTSGEIWLYREMKRNAAPPEAMEVLNLAVKYGIRVRISNVEDFSDIKP